MRHKLIRSNRIKKKRGEEHLREIDFQQKRSTEDRDLKARETRFQMKKVENSSVGSVQLKQTGRTSTTQNQQYRGGEVVFRESYC